MLHSTDPPQPPLTTSYGVPWVVTRKDPAHPVVMNAGIEPVDFVKVLRSDASSVDLVDLWGQVLPAESIEMCLCDSDLDDVVVTIAWFRQRDGLEYVWRFVV